MSGPGPGRGARALRATWLACLLLGLLLAPGFNSFESPDDPTVLALTRHGHLWVDRDSGGIYHTGVDGRVYTVHELGSILFAAPFALAAEPVSRATGVAFKRVYGVALGFASAALFATTVLLLLLLGERLGAHPGDLRPRLLVLLLASQYLVYATSPSDVSLAAPLLAGGALAWQCGEEDGRPGAWLLAGLLGGLLVAVKLTMATAAAMLVVLGLSRLRGRRAGLRDLGLVAAGLVPGLALAAAWNALRTGSPLAVPYPPAVHGFRLSLTAAGIASALLSPGKGMLVYTPALLLAPWAVLRRGTLARHWRLAALVAGSWAVALVRIAGTVGGTSWGGWGNRYYVPWVPLFVLAVAVRWSASAATRRAGAGALRVALWALAAAGLVVNVAGIVTNQMYRQQLCGYGDWQVHGMNLCAVEALPANLARTAGAAIPDVVVPGASAANVFASNRLALWWYAARAFGLPPAASWALGLACAAGALLAWRRASRREAAP